jgi:hypothetical protein
MDLNFGMPRPPGEAAKEPSREPAYTDGEALFLATLFGGGLACFAVAVVALSEPDKRSSAAAAQYSQIAFWNVLMLTLADRRYVTWGLPGSPQTSTRYFVVSHDVLRHSV